MVEEALLASLQLNVVALTMLRWTIGGNSFTLVLNQQSLPRLRRLKLLDHSLQLIQAYGLNSSANYPGFVSQISDVMRKIKAKKSTILLRDFTAHPWNDASRVWKQERCDWRTWLT